MIEDISDFMWNDGKPKDKLRGRLPLSRARLVDYQVYNQIDLGTKTKGRNARENRKSNWSNILYRLASGKKTSLLQPSLL